MSPSASNLHAKHLEKEGLKADRKYGKSSLIGCLRLLCGGKRENRSGSVAGRRSSWI